MSSQTPGSEPAQPPDGLDLLLRLQPRLSHDEQLGFGCSKRRCTEKSWSQGGRHDWVGLAYSSFVPKRRTVEVDPFALKARKPVPHRFILETLAPLSPETRLMFGCLAVYVGDKIVCILRDKRDETVRDDGMWLATTTEHHKSLRRDFPRMRSIGVLGKKITGWQVLPASSPDFEEAALRACEFIINGDPRIGKIPESRRRGLKKLARKPKAAKRSTRS